MRSVKTGIRNVIGVETIVILLLASGGVASLFVWQQDVPRRENLANEKGTLLGFETRHSRYSSYEYLLIRINGQSERLRLWACISDLKRLPLGEEISVLRMQKTLFEASRAGTVACSYGASAQALASYQNANRATTGLALGAAALLIALLARTGWRTGRHLDKLARAQAHRATH